MLWTRWTLLAQLPSEWGTSKGETATKIAVRNWKVPSLSRSLGWGCTIDFGTSMTASCSTHYAITLMVSLWHSAGPPCDNNFSRWGQHKDKDWNSRACCGTYLQRNERALGSTVPRLTCLDNLYFSIANGSDSICVTSWCVWIQNLHHLDGSYTYRGVSIAKW